MSKSFIDKLRQGKIDITKSEAEEILNRMVNNVPIDKLPSIAKGVHYTAIGVIPDFNQRDMLKAFCTPEFSSMVRNIAINGVRNPVEVGKPAKRDEDQRLQLLAGHLRLASIIALDVKGIWATKACTLPVRAVTRTLFEDKVAITHLRLTENSCRLNLTPCELSRDYNDIFDKLTDKARKDYCEEKEAYDIVAAEYSTSVRQVKRYMALRFLPASVQAMVDDESIPIHIGAEIIKHPEAVREKLAQDYVDNPKTSVLHRENRDRIRGKKVIVKTVEEIEVTGKGIKPTELPEVAALQQTSLTGTQPAKVEAVTALDKIIAAEKTVAPSQSENSAPSRRDDTVILAAIDTCEAKGAALTAAALRWAMGLGEESLAALITEDNYYTSDENGDSL